MKRKHYVTARVNRGEREMVLKAADRAGISVSIWVRLAVTRAAKDQK